MTAGNKPVPTSAGFSELLPDFQLHVLAGVRHGFGMRAAIEQRNGGYYVSGTRITLDAVVCAFNRGVALNRSSKATRCLAIWLGCMVQSHSIWTIELLAAFAMRSSRELVSYARQRFPAVQRIGLPAYQGASRVSV